MEVSAVFTSSEGRHAEAVRMTAAAAALTETTGATPPLMLARGRVEEAARRAIGDAAVEKALAEGRNMTLGEAIDYARNLATPHAKQGIDDS
jgi:hypothetical protein